MGRRTERRERERQGERENSRRPLCYIARERAHTSFIFIVELMLLWEKVVLLPVLFALFQVYGDALLDWGESSSR